MPPESRRAICSLALTRLAMSPAWRWVKNSTGSAMTCQRKRLIMTTASLVCSLSSSDWRSSRQDGAERRGHGHADQQRNEPARGVLDQDVIDEDFRKSRGDDTGHDQREAEDHQQPDRLFRAAQLAQQQPQSLRLFAEFLERLGWLHGEHDAGEREIEFGHVDPSPSDRRVVDVDAVALDAFQHHEMIEVPVDDARHRHFVQRRGLLAEALGDKTEAARRLDDVARLAAVARDPAGDAQLLQRDPRAVVGKHHRQRRGPAFDRFHLQDCRCPLHRVAPERSAGATWTAAASRPALLGQGRHPSIPVSRLMRGRTRSSGRCLRVVISARISVPLLRRIGGPLPTAQRYPLTVVVSCSRLTLAA